ncbi:MAG: SMC family ATPase [Solirubrobacteraceae bacterium MAG38_C4-C5]|nr:SMC family ATPase [Candidatus Siliceabacter maunaloa]
MRPLRLEIQGFTSFREHQPVDFSELGLFVITGPTGVGKTSILDAMALALYGAVPRMGKSGLSALVSHGQSEARVLLEFSVDDERYRVSRRLRRVGAQQGKLERRAGDEWVDAASGGGIMDINRDVQALIKLDFESFCKAVVLPQGEFARFLKGDRSERRSTLVTLLGVGHFERMRQVAGERAREIKIKTQQTQELLESEFADATADAVAGAQADADAAAERADALVEQLGAARALARRRDEQEAARARADGIAGDLQGLGEALAAQHDGCYAAEESARAAEHEREGAHRVAEEGASALAMAETNLADRAARLGSVEDLARLADAARSLPELADDRASAEASAQSVLRQQADAADEVVSLAQAVAAADAEHVEAQAAHERLVPEHRDADGARQSAEHRLATARAAEKAQDRAQGEVAAAGEEQESAAVTAECAAAEAAGLERELASLQREHTATVLVAGLAPGDLCPVCERPLEEHPRVDREVETKLGQSGEQAASARDAAAKADRAVAAAEARLDGAQRALATGRRDLEQALTDATDTASLEAALADAVGRVEQFAAERDATQKVLESATGEHAAQREKLAAAVQRRDGLVAQHDQCTRVLEKAAVAHDAAFGFLRERFGDEVPADAAIRLEADRDTLAAAQRTVETARTHERTVREALVTAERAAVDAQQALSQVDLDLQESRTRAAEALRRAGEIGTAVVHLPEPAQARDARATELRAWTYGAVAVVREASEHATMLGRQLDEQLVAAAAAHDLTPTDGDGALSGLARVASDALTAKGAAEHAARALADKLQSREKLEGQIAEDSQRASVLEILARELRADRFVEFMIQETLDLLAAQASDELLRISDRRYSLISADGEFSVIDHVNADEQRSVKTLSGGETFMASLSLALALSQHVSDLAGEGLGARLEAVFIDEGFGSLDPETLEEVIDALERLRDADLLVGIISHVPEVATRIVEGLDVRREGSRSVVTVRGA